MSCTMDNNYLDFSGQIDIILIETLGGSQIEKELICPDILVKNGYRFDTKYRDNEVFILENKYMTSNN